MGDNHRTVKLIEITCANCADTFQRAAFKVKGRDMSTICCTRGCARQRDARARYQSNRDNHARKRAEKAAVAELQFTAPEFRDEEWKPIPKWEAYEASSLGRIRRALVSQGTFGESHIMRTTFNQKGYPMVSLCVNRRKLTATVHALIATTFLGTRQHDMTVNHKDGIKTHNAVHNLEYCTNADNMKHAARMGLMARGDNAGLRKHPESVKRGEQNKLAKLTDEKVREIIRLLKEGHTAQSIARTYGVSGNRVCQIRRGNTWRHITCSPLEPSTS